MAHEMEEREEIMKVQFELQQKHYKDNLKKTLQDIKSQKKRMEESNAKKKKALDEQSHLITRQREAIEYKKNENRSLQQKYENEIALLKAKLHKSEESNNELQNYFSLVEAKADSPRVIHTHPNFESLVENAEKATLSKRLRTSSKIYDNATAISEDASITLNDSTDSKDN